MPRTFCLLSIALLLGVFASSLPAAEDSPETNETQKPASPGKVVAVDYPNDVGTKLDLAWETSPDDKADADPRVVTSYRIDRSSSVDDGWVKLVTLPYGTTKFEDVNCKRGRSYRYRVVALGPEGLESEPSETPGLVESSLQFFNLDRSWFAVIVAIICGSVIAFILIARSGRPLKIRKIAGLEVVDEAVGRATEMGRSCLFIPGIQDINDIQTIAGITILGHVAKTAAEYNATIEVPTARALVMTTAQETVEASFLSAGRPDAYNEDKIYYVTDEQFGYVAYLSGLLVREKPAACFYMGSFYAESLILAETGNAIGAIQIAGTAQPAQLPFFVAACDYTLIGEEFFAASAYLSEEPDQLGSLKGQDVGKLVVAALLIVGCLLATWESVSPEAAIPKRSLNYLKTSVLDAGVKS